MDKMKLQTLQIYKKVEKIPLDVQIRKMTGELDTIRKEHPTSMFIQDPLPEILREPPSVKTIDFQNMLTKMEKELSYWVNDYRILIAELREVNRILPKNNHELTVSDEKAQENVNKIIKVEEIKEQLLTDFKNIFLQYEDNDSKLRRRNRQLESQLLGIQAKVDNLEYQVKRSEKKQNNF